MATIQAEKCSYCDGLGFHPDWGVTMSRCGMCLGMGMIHRGRIAELFHMEKWYREHAPKREQREMADVLKCHHGYVREEKH